MPAVTFIIPAKDVQRTKAFFDAILNLSIPSNAMDPTGSSYALKIEDSSFLTISPRNSADETPLCYFQVEDLGAIVQATTTAGGKVLAGPFVIQVANKNAAQGMILSDPDGNGFGIFAI